MTDLCSLSYRAADIAISRHSDFALVADDVGKFDASWQSNVLTLAITTRDGGKALLQFAFSTKGLAPCLATAINRVTRESRI